MEDEVSRMDAEIALLLLLVVPPRHGESLSRYLARALARLRREAAEAEGEEIAGAGGH